MVSFFGSLLAPFKVSRRRDTHQSDGPTSQPGPYATGATIEAQTPPRRRQFWQSSSTISSPMSTSIAAKSEKPAKGQKMGTVSGVFIPTTLNVLSILMYLRVFYVAIRLNIVRLCSWTKWSGRNASYVDCLIFDQFTDSTVGVGHRDKWQSKGRRRLLYDFSVIRS